MTDRSPSLAEVISKALDHRLSQVHVCMPGIVVSYDSESQTAEIRPGNASVIVSDDGEIVDQLPTMFDVPVAHPRAGNWFIHFPLSPGDSVVLHFAERALDQWRLKGGQQNPLDLRMHNLSDAIAVPANLHVDAAALTGLGDHLTIGMQGGKTIHVKDDGTIAIGSEFPADAAATAAKVGAQLSALASVLTAWVPVPGDGGSALKLLLTTLISSGWPGSVASSVVKVDP